MGMVARMPIIGKRETQFWIRAFQIEKEIDDIVKTLDKDTRRKTAFCPIIYEYEAGSMKYHALFGVTVDSLGLVDALGMLWISTGEENHKKAEEQRNQWAKEMLETSEGREWDEVVTLEKGREV